MRLPWPGVLTQAGEDYLEKLVESGEMPNLKAAGLQNLAAKDMKRVFSFWEKKGRRFWRFSSRRREGRRVVLFLVECSVSIYESVILICVTRTSSTRFW